MHKNPPIILALQPHIINQISAGEVVERPASVIKELVENALDAGATALTVKWRQGGQSMMSVQDNGCGMTKEDMHLAIARHTTSKLNHGNLSRIQTFGFRGEALAAIVAISRVRLVSRPVDPHGDPGHGWELIIEGGIIRSESPVPAPHGTTIDVRDLFFATPARLKFMRSPAIEHAHIIDHLERIALSAPHVDLNLAYDTRTKVYAPGIENRLKLILGQSFLDNTCLINQSTQGHALTGWVSMPTYNRSAMDHQFFFVNQRPVKDKIIGATLKAAFANTLMHGRYPAAVLYFETPLEDVDVNVHPAKTEVRFKDLRFVRQFLISSIKSELAKNIAHANAEVNVIFPESSLAKTHIPPLQQSYGQGAHLPNNSSMQDKASAPVIKHMSIDSMHSMHQPTPPNPSFETKKSMAPSTPHLINSLPIAPHCAQENTEKSMVSPDASFMHPYAMGLPLESMPFMSSQKQSLSFLCPRLKPEGDDKKEAIIEKNLLASLPLSLCLGQAIKQIQQSYIIAENAQGLVLVDPHAAHERIVFEHMKTHWNQNIGAIEQILLPQDLLLSFKEQEMIEVHHNILKNVGFDCHIHDGICTVLTIPLIFKAYDITLLLKELVSCLCQEIDPLELMLKWRDEKMANWACRQSLKLGQAMSLEEMNALLRTLEKTPNSGQCNHGRPVYRMMSTHQIQTFFERR